MEGNNNPYITDKMRNYEPSNENMFITIASGDYQRLIFSEPLELRSREEENWESFEDYIADNGLDPIPEYYKSHERIGLRFLQGC